MKKITWLLPILTLIILASCKLNNDTEPPQESKQEEEFIQKGKEITQATFQALSQELQKSMQQGGVEEAITYCNVNALPITEKLSKEYNAVIKRTSLKYRNPKNAPSDQEIHVLNEFQTDLETNMVLKPKLSEAGGQYTFYAPIITQEMCLKCHGAKESISAYDLISAKYPEDLATGHLAGDLRGMWSVAFVSVREE
jgi:hypothetical protein